MKKTLQDLEIVLRNVFPNQTSFSLDQKKEDINDWDSIAHLSLIVDIEEYFDVKFSREEIQELDSVSKIIDKINKQNGK